jgi:hypothetical protein
MSQPSACGHNVLVELDPAVQGFLTLAAKVSEFKTLVP